MNTYFKKPLALFLLLFGLISCGPSVNTLVNNENRIPASFNNFQGTLLIQEADSRFNRMVQDIFSEYYKGKFMLVKEISGKYPKEDHRFAIIYNLKNFTVHEYGSSTHIYLMDRNTQEEYLIGSRPNYKNTLVSLAKALEIRRTK